MVLDNNGYTKGFDTFRQIEFLWMQRGSERCFTSEVIGSLHSSSTSSNLPSKVSSSLKTYSPFLRSIWRSPWQREKFLFETSAFVSSCSILVRSSINLSLLFWNLFSRSDCNLSFNADSSLLFASSDSKDSTFFCLLCRSNWRWFTKFSSSKVWFGVSPMKKPSWFSILKTIIAGLSS